MRSIRRTAAVLLGACALAVPYWSIAGAEAATKATTATKSFTGPAGVAGRWGEVTVRITVRRTTTTNTSTKKKTVKRRITAVKVVTYPNHTDRSVFISQQAFPTLIQETLKGQTGSIDMVSGATDTSEGFATSLQSAILQAKKW